ncbi:unnamed protein product [Rotaria sordida]|uniref:Cell cycle checkpoint control protein RAD9A n=2 Tax=Rotaria sordida TaxID=392033 RepID=A0A815K7H7_9BILA|nr:unnamed protein product [Rotaria sordida]CAF1389173.1 unnamed protein product [Rotaria sordida]
MTEKKFIFVIPPEHVRHFGKALQVLTKLGEEIYIELITKTNGLSFRTANQSRSSYSCITFYRDFFQEWPQDDLQKEKIKCRISAKRCMSAVHAVLSSKLTRLELVFDDRKSNLSFILHCRYNIIKIHSCFYIDCEKLQARFDKQSYKNCVSIMSKTLQDLTAHFPAKWDEITIRATKDQFIIKKCDEIVHDDESIVYGMNFQVVCEPREFISYDIQYKSDITFCLREFKFLLGLADLLNLPMTIYFDSRGRPIIFCFDAEEFYFDGTFVFATMANREGETDISFNMTQTSVNDTSTMDEDDLVSYRQYTINTTGVNRGGKKRPAPSTSPTLETQINPIDEEFNIDEDNISIDPKQRISTTNHKNTTTTAFGDTTYTVLSQQSIVGLQQSEDFMADMTDDEDEEN